ncbi:hypothetical protein Tco_0510635 [Tanacetum coccineum]
MFSTPPSSPSLLDVLGDLLPSTTNPLPPRPSFATIECLANEPPPIPPMDSTFPLPTPELEPTPPPIPPQCLPPPPSQLPPLPPLGPNNPFPLLTHEMYTHNYTTTTLHFGERSLLHGHQLIYQRQHASNVGEVFSISHSSSSGLSVLSSTHLRNLYISKKIPSLCRYQVYTLDSSNLSLLTSTPTTLGLDTSS